MHASVIELVLDEDEANALGVTPNHPLYSVDRDAWVTAGEFEIGERVETQDGVAATVTAVHDEGRRDTVYNLEVHRIQSYYVGTSKVLAHNTCFEGLLQTFSNSGRIIDPADKTGTFTRAGRALKKHGNREGSAFPKASGNAAQINEQGQEVLDDILTSHGANMSSGNRFKGFDVWKVDEQGSKTQGARFDSYGAFRGFLEPE